MWVCPILSNAIISCKRALPSYHVKGHLLIDVLNIGGLSKAKSLLPFSSQNIRPVQAFAMGDCGQFKVFGCLQWLTFLKTLPQAYTKKGPMKGMSLNVKNVNRMMHIYYIHSIPIMDGLSGSPLTVLVSEGSVTRRTPVRNKQKTRSICLLTPEHPREASDEHEPNHTSTTNHWSPMVHKVRLMCMSTRTWNQILGLNKQLPITMLFPGS